MTHLAPVDWPPEPQTDPWDDRAVQRAPVEQQPARPPLGQRVLTREQLRDLLPPQPLVDDTLDVGTLALLVGAWGTCKTFVALSWACSVATGHAWLGRETRAGPVLYVAAEGTSGLDQRIAAWEYVWRAPANALTVLPEALPLGDSGAVREIAAAAAGHRLVVFDTLNRCLGASGLDENSARDMGTAVDALDQIRRATGATVLVLHHLGKDDSRGARGHSSLEAAVDTVYRITGDPQHLDLTRSKRKDGPLEDRHVLRAEPHLDSLVVVSHGGSWSPLDATVSEIKLLATVRDLAETNGLPASTLLELSGLSKATYYRAQKALVSRGELVNVGTARSPRYAVPGGEQ